MSKPAPRNWDVITTSSHPHEQRGLEFLWSNLPDHEPYKGWSNFEFTGLDGSQNEVDALVVSKQGLFLLELKAHPGYLVRADQADLQIKTPEGRSVQISHPIRLANLKAKRLKDLLVRQAGSKGREIPFIEPLCFLTNVDGFKPKIPSHLISGLVVADPQHRRAGHEKEHHRRAVGGRADRHGRRLTSGEERGHAHHRQGDARAEPAWDLLELKDQPRG